MDISDYYDIIRLIGVLSCGVLLLTAPIAMMQKIPWHQKIRFGGLGAVAVAVGEAFLTMLGQDPSTYWRIPLLSLGLVLAAAGTAVHVWKLVFPPR